MTREQWQQVKAIAIEAWGLPAADRPRYVTAACGADSVLLREVESLIASMGAAGDRFETPALILPGGDTAIRGVIDGPAIAAASGRIGGWRILKPLGHGGMGTVYLAERADAGFSQRAAIKLARGGYADGFLRQRFLDERRILATLEHPDIARLIDGGATEDGAPYVVMEFVDGVPIDTYCVERQLGLRQRIELFRRVCAAVHYAHQRLVVHRDIKPANILVTADGEPKLLDFGIAKLLDANVAQTQTLVRMVTPESASPEQIRGDIITTATDVYQLGTLLYRLLTGQGPYGPGRSETDLIRAVCEETPRPPSAVAPQRQVSGTLGVAESIPSDVDVIVMKTLRKEPERRYGTVEQLSNDLQRYLEGRPVTAAADRAGYRARKFVHRHRLGVAAVAALLMTLCGGIGTTLWQARVARLERERADVNRARAERQFSAVRGLANTVLGELHDAVVALPGSIKAREVLLRRATEYLDTLKAEAADDVELRRELARGYRRLAQVQGDAGMPNVGDTQAARRSIGEVISLLDSIGAATSTNAWDRIYLAEACLKARAFEPERRPELLDRARTLIENIPVSPLENPAALAVLSSAWNEIGDDQVAGKRYEAALAPFQKAVEISESAHRLEPDSPDRSRNVSLAYKKLGAVYQVLKRFDEALALFDKSMLLDTNRVAREPQGALWKLDLSFTYGSIASVLGAKGDLRRALDQADKAVALREEAVALDPGEDFAKGALARGYDRQASLRFYLGDLPGAVDSQLRRVALYDRRLKEHPDRQHFITEYLSIASNAADASLGYLEQGRVSADFRRSAARRIETVLNSVDQLHANRAAPKPAAAAGLPADTSRAEFERAVARCRALMK
jgi:eukaryotic-like serine/threonine-protein kinase